MCACVDLTDRRNIMLHYIILHCIISPWWPSTFCWKISMLVMPPCSQTGPNEMNERAAFFAVTLSIAFGVCYKQEIIIRRGEEKKRRGKDLGKLKGKESQTSASTLFIRESWCWRLGHLDQLAHTVVSLWLSLSSHLDWKTNNAAWGRRKQRKEKDVWEVRGRSDGNNKAEGDFKVIRGKWVGMSIKMMAEGREREGETVQRSVD